jgi:ribosomal protein L29
MKYSEIENLNLNELKKKSLQIKRDIFQLKMKNKLGRLENPISIRKNRKDYARFLTAISKQVKKGK